VVTCAACHQPAVLAETYEVDFRDTADDNAGSENKAGLENNNLQYLHEHCFRCSTCSKTLNHDDCIYRDRVRYCLNCEEKTREEAVGNWHCRRCTYENSPIFAACNMCRTERAWFEDVPIRRISGDRKRRERSNNSNNVSRRGGNGAPGDITLEEARTIVQRDVSNHLNNPSSPNNPGSQVQNRPQGGVWRCTLCTYDNEAGRTHCEICGYRHVPPA